MNKTKLLGLSMTAVFTTLLLSGATSAYAGVLAPQCGSVFDIDSAIVFENSDEVSMKVNLVNCNNLLQFDDYGAGVLTDGTLAVTASHGADNGFIDSELQVSPQTFGIPHNHLVNLGDPADTNTESQTDCFSQGADARVLSLTFESPGVAMFLGTQQSGDDIDMYKMWEVPKEFSARDALDMGAGFQSWTLGNIGAPPQVVTFSLTLGDDGVCVFIEDDVEADLEDLLRKVGGLPMVIDSNVLVLAGIQSTAMWMLPIVAVAAGAGAFFIRSRISKD